MNLFAGRGEQIDPLLAERLEDVPARLPGERGRPAG